MAVSVLNYFIDTKTLLAISSEPDGCIAIGNLFQMISLAIHDPEGCVRLTPNSSMDTESFAKYSNCTVDMIKQSIETLLNYDLITMEDGKIYVTLLRKQKMKKSAALQKEAKAAEQRAKGAARTAASRANKKFRRTKKFLRKTLRKP